MSYRPSDLYFYLSSLNVAGDVVAFTPSNSVTLGPNDLYVASNVYASGDIIAYSPNSNAVLGTLYATNDIFGNYASMPFSSNIASSNMSLRDLIIAANNGVDPGGPYKLSMLVNKNAVTNSSNLNNVLVPSANLIDFAPFQHASYVTWIMPKPAAVQNNPVYATYDPSTSTYNMTWSFALSNTTISSIVNTNLVTSYWDSNVGQLTGKIAFNTYPTCTISLTNSAKAIKFIDTTISSAFTGNVSSPHQPISTSPTVTQNTPTYGTYNGTNWPITWTFNIANCTSSTITTTNISSASWNPLTATITGFAASGTVPTCVLSLTNSMVGYSVAQLSPSFTAATSSPIILSVNVCDTSDDGLGLANSSPGFAVFPYAALTTAMQSCAFFTVDADNTQNTYVAYFPSAWFAKDVFKYGPANLHQTVFHSYQTHTFYFHF